MQFQSNVLGQTVIRPQTAETTALGAAYLAGLAVGFWENVEEVQKQWHVDSTFEPDPKVDMLLTKKKWSEAVHRAQSWIK